MENQKLNLAYPQNFKLDIPGYPNLTKNIVRFNIPGISIGLMETPQPNVLALMNPGDSIEFQEIAVDFIISEDLSTLTDIWDWMNKCSEFDDLNVAIQNTVDAKIAIMSNSGNVIKNITLTDFFPYSTIDINIETSDGESEPLLFTANFKYTEIKY